MRCVGLRARQGFRLGAPYLTKMGGHASRHGEERGKVMTPQRRTAVRAALLALLAGAVLGVWPGVATAAGVVAMPAGDSPTRPTPLAALLAAQQAKLTPGDGAAYDYFGYAVALSGDTALVGAQRATVEGDESRGAAYVFVRSGAVWTLQGKLAASDGEHGDHFGTAVALSGDMAVIGADVAGAADQGAVYVFTRSGGVWSEQARVSISAPDAYPRFGCAVALAGDTIVAGAYWSDHGGAADQGAAYVFTGGGDTWTPQARLRAGGGEAGDQFGVSVALDGDTCLVGADLGGVADKGAASVFTRSGGQWTERATLAASDGAYQDQFGHAVALAGGTALAGAQAAGSTDQGSAYVFTGAGGSWAQQAKLTVTGSRYFGSSVALSGETAIVGAMWDDGGAADLGAAYVFRRAGSVWTKQMRLTAADGRASDLFGRSVAVSGDTAIVGAPHEWLEGNAYVFTGLLLVRPATPQPRSPKGLVSSRTPALRWGAAARAVTYEVRVLRGSRVLAKKVGVRTTSWKCSSRLPRKLWLTWQARAVNAAGASAWSRKLSFRVR
jgi:hypothetical protein